MVPVSGRRIDGAGVQRDSGSTFLRCEVRDAGGPPSSRSVRLRSELCRADNANAGTGILVLSAAGGNTYTGATTVNVGALKIANENALGGDPDPGASVFIPGQLTLNGGTLYASADVIIDDSWRGITLGVGGGTMSVDPLKALTVKNVITGAGGLTKGYVDASDTGVVSPGSATDPTKVGTSKSGSETWNGGGAYSVDMTNATGGSGVGYDLIDFSGGLTIAATSGSPFAVMLNGTGVSNFDIAGSYRWPIVKVSGSISGFESGKFTLITSGFPSNLGSGHFGLAVSGDGTTLDITFGKGDPTAVTVASFGAYRRNGRVVAMWQTASLGTTLGFDLYRRSRTSGKWIKVNRSLIPAQFGRPAGGTYEVGDRQAPTACRLTYRLKEICAGGGMRWHGPCPVLAVRLAGVTAQSLRR